MTIFLWLLLIATAIAAVAMLIRGIVTFLQTTEEDLKSQSTGPSASGLKQNRMMMGRIFFQAIAILIAALILLLSR
ncbi:MAG TPA: hypothetical protein VE567_04730 [Sphingomonas sp.]|nr:hypothetical protein [Sphingomonas sp.]